MKSMTLQMIEHSGQCLAGADFQGLCQPSYSSVNDLYALSRVTLSRGSRVSRVSRFHTYVSPELGLEEVPYDLSL